MPRALVTGAAPALSGGQEHVGLSATDVDPPNDACVRVDIQDPVPVFTSVITSVQAPITAGTPQRALRGDELPSTS